MQKVIFRTCWPILSCIKGNSCEQIARRGSMRQDEEGNRSRIAEIWCKNDAESALLTVQGLQKSSNSDRPNDVSLPNRAIRYASQAPETCSLHFASQASLTAWIQEFLTYRKGRPVRFERDTSNPSITFVSRVEIKQLHNVFIRSSSSPNLSSQNPTK